MSQLPFGPGWCLGSLGLLDQLSMWRFRSHSPVVPRLCPETTEDDSEPGFLEDLGFILGCACASWRPPRFSLLRIFMCSLGTFISLAEAGCYGAASPRSSECEGRDHARRKEQWEQVLVWTLLRPHAVALQKNLCLPCTLFPLGGAGLRPGPSGFWCWRGNQRGCAQSSVLACVVCKRCPRLALPGFPGLI